MELPTPVPRVDVDPNFERQLRNLRDAARAQAPALRSGGQVRWTRPLGWNGDPHDYAGIHAALNRDTANQQCVDALADPNLPGTTGDVVAATLMVDYLATMERAFKNRVTMGKCRRLAHAAGRRAGHGSDTGPLIQCPLEFLRRLVQRSKGSQ